MIFQYSTSSPLHDESDSLPRIPMILRYGKRSLPVVGLVDSGATVNVLPHSIGLQLGAAWNDAKATIRLSQSLNNQAAMALYVDASIGEIAPVRLAFAWAKNDNVPLILGQMNFFMEFDITFYRSRLEFEVHPKGQS